MATKPDLLFALLQQDSDLFQMGGQDLRRLGEHGGLFVLNMLLDMVPSACGI